MNLSTIFSDYSQEANQITRFLITGVLATAIHLSILYLLTEFTPLWYLPATVVGFLSAFVVSFTLQKLWTFRSTVERKTGRQLYYFFLMQLAALYLNVVGLYFLVEFLDIWYFAGQIFLLVLTACVTYFISKHLIFTYPKALEVRLKTDILWKE